MNTVSDQIKENNDFGSNLLGRGFFRSSLFCLNNNEHFYCGFFLFVQNIFIGVRIITMWWNFMICQNYILHVQW